MIGGCDRRRLTIDAGTLEDLASLAAWSQAIALDLERVSMFKRRQWNAHFSLATGLAVHRLARFDRGTARCQTVNADRRARHRTWTAESWREEKVEAGGAEGNAKCGEDPVPPEFSSIDFP